MCIDPSDLSPCPLFNCKILMVLLWCTFCHQKQPTHYTDLVFMPLFLQQLEGTGEVDLVWNHYLANSIKGLTRGSGVTIKESLMYVFVLIHT